MAILKAERKTCNDVQPLLSLHLINALIRSVKKMCFAKIDLGETLHLKSRPKAVSRNVLSAETIRLKQQHYQV